MSLALVNFLPDDTTVPFIKARLAAFGFSALMLVASIAAFFAMGLNFGIDFTGGVTLEVRTEEQIDAERIDEMRTLLNGLGFGAVELQGLSELTEGSDCFGDHCALIRVQPQEGEGIEAEEAQQAANLAVQAALTEQYPGIEFRSINVLGPKVSGELVQAGVTSIVVALVLMLIYIWFRFEWQYSVGAVLALVHDVIITIGMFAVTQLEFNLSTIAAILTIVGYSMNDTVVVYDRIREKLRKFKKESLAEVLNRAINKTLSRTILTSVTTLVALISLWVLGGAALQGFAFAMIFGVVIGTYSSIFIAAPLLLVTQVKRESAES
ncbi:protein translocase subunit SecF [Hyphobacterium sp.]|jgi:preprotein translocase SecF subunit|uniref:protein translocase subunit SecF n=1 Tax=Hyphobacterium sp. TaxID=2004662 RepID=UPI003BAA4505